MSALLDVNSHCTAEVSVWGKKWDDVQNWVGRLMLKWIITIHWNPCETWGSSVYGWIGLPHLKPNTKNPNQESTCSYLRQCQYFIYLTSSLMLTTRLNIYNHFFLSPGCFLNFCCSWCNAVNLFFSFPNWMIRLQRSKSRSSACCCCGFCSLFLCKEFDQLIR